MMKNLLKYAVGTLVLVVIAYNSVYFRKLDEVRASSTTFDAKSYARKYFNNKLLPSLNNAVEINQLLSLLQNNKEQTFEKYSHALGIGNIRYFLVKGEGRVTAINENDVSVLAKADTNAKAIRIATEFVFGNAIRDASGKIDINEFANTMDFNNVSAEINKIVRAEVLPSFRAGVKKGDTVQFAGAIELNKEHLNVDNIEVIPVQLKIINSSGQ
jgi:predicted lipoprotein